MILKRVLCFDCFEFCIFFILFQDRADRGDYEPKSEVPRLSASSGFTSEPSNISSQPSTSGFPDSWALNVDDFFVMKASSECEYTPAYFISISNNQY